jgi:hypothetical protein
VARDITGAAFDAIWPQIREHFAMLIETQNPDRDAALSAANGGDLIGCTRQHILNTITHTEA